MREDEVDLREVDRRAVDPDRDLEALRTLSESLEDVRSNLGPDSPLVASSERLAAVIDRVIAAPETDADRIDALQRVWLGTLPGQLRRLDRSLSVGSIEMTFPGFMIILGSSARFSASTSSSAASLAFSASSAALLAASARVRAASSRIMASSAV